MVRSRSPVVGFQSLIVLSREPLARTLVLGLKETKLTSLVWLVMARSRSPVVGYQSLIVLSAEPLARTLVVGLKETDQT